MLSESVECISFIRLRSDLHTYRSFFIITTVALSNKINSEWHGHQAKKVMRWSYQTPPTHKKMRPINLYIEDKSPSTLKGYVEIIAQTFVTQSKKNIVTATVALTSPRATLISPRNSHTHRISTIVKQLSCKIWSQCLLI